MADDDKPSEADSQLERHPDQSYPVAVAPSRVDDDEPLNSLRPGLMTVACWRLDDARFKFDSSFILPAAASDLKRLGAMHEDYLGSPMSIFGHADPVGTDDHNKKLSGNRARALHALLVRDLDAWEELFNQHGWGLASSQLILMDLDSRELARQANPTAGGFSAKTGVGPDAPPFVGPANGQDTQAWDKAVRRFQTAQGLGVDGTAGPNTRRKLHELYMDALTSQPDGKSFKFAAADFLGKGADPKGKAAFQGCSEFNPIILLSEKENKAIDKGAEPHLKRDARNAPNRRVVLYFFPVGFALDDVSKWPCPRASEGSGACKKRFWTDSAKRVKADKELTRAYGPIVGEPLLKPTQDTFACRFYDRLARRSPCEAGFNEWVVQLLFPGPELLSKRPRVGGVKFVAVSGSGKTVGVTDENGMLRVRARAPDDTVTVTLKVPLDEPKRDKKDDKSSRSSSSTSSGNANASNSSKDAGDAAPPTTTVTLVLRGGKLSGLEEPDKRDQALDDRLRSLGFGALGGKLGLQQVRDPDAAIEEFKELEGVEDGDDLDQQVHDRYGS